MMARLVNDGPPDATERLKLMRNDDRCHSKARSRGEQTFTLVERDPTAPKAILFWIMENFDGQTPAPKLRDAVEDALAMLFSEVEKRRAD